MISKTIQNKKLQQNQHNLLILHKLKELSNNAFGATYSKKASNGIHSNLISLKFNKHFFQHEKSITSTPLSLHKLKRENFTNLNSLNSKIQMNNSDSWNSLNSKMNNQVIQNKINEINFELHHKKSTNLRKKSIPCKWFNYFFFNNPINLLFSIDDFLFEFAKKQPRRRKSSEFQQQLKQRKKLTIFYGYLSKKQLKNLLSQSKYYQGYFSKNFFSIVERRLDVLLYRSGLVKNIITARQLISHKKIMVNNQIQNIASYQVNPGDIIRIIPKNNEILSPLSETIQAKFKKRRSHYNISQNFIYKLQNKTYLKNKKQKKTIKNYVGLLLIKVQERAYLKINNYLFQNEKNISIQGDFSPIPFMNKFSSSKQFKINSLASSKEVTSKNLVSSQEVTSKNLVTCNQVRNKNVNFEQRNFTVLKLKPLISKTAKSYLLMCLQKNYLSFDKKSIFQNKYTRFINLCEKYDIFFNMKKKHLDSYSKIRSFNKDINKKNKNNAFSGKNNTGRATPLENGGRLNNKNASGKNTIQSKKQSNAVNYFTRKLSNFTNSDFLHNKKSTKSTQKNFIPKSSSIFHKKRVLAIYKNIVYKTLLQMHFHFLYSCYFANFKSLSGFSTGTFNAPLSKNITPKNKDIAYNKSNLQKKITNTLLTLKFKKHIKKKRSRKQILRGLCVCVIKAMHIEVSYSMSTAILLYSPQRLSFPFYIDVDLILRSFR